MWICLNRAFLSIVQPKQHDYRRYLDEVGPGSMHFGDMPNNAKHALAIRSRSLADLKQAVPAEWHSRIVTWPGRDYPVRIMLPRDFVANLIAASVRSIGYENFKDSVRDRALHDAYMAVWGVMHRYQHGAFDPKPVRATADLFERNPTGRGKPRRRGPGKVVERHNAVADTLDPFGPSDDVGSMDYVPRSARGMPGTD